MLAPISPLSPDQRERLGRLGWEMARRLLLATAAAVGTKLGERLVEAILGDEPGEDDDPEDPGQ